MDELSPDLRRAEYQADGQELLTAAVVKTVAAATDAAPTDLPPLFDAVEPEALDGLFRQDDADGFVRFRYHGFVVLAYGDGLIEVYDAD